MKQRLEMDWESIRADTKRAVAERVAMAYEASMREISIQLEKRRNVKNAWKKSPIDECVIPNALLPAAPNVWTCPSYPMLPPPPALPPTQCSNESQEGSSKIEEDLLTLRKDVVALQDQLGIIVERVQSAESSRHTASESTAKLERTSRLAARKSDEALESISKFGRTFAGRLAHEDAWKSRIRDSLDAMRLSIDDCRRQVRAADPQRWCETAEATAWLRSHVQHTAIDTDMIETAIETSVAKFRAEFVEALASTRIEANAIAEQWWAATGQAMLDRRVRDAVEASAAECCERAAAREALRFNAATTRALAELRRQSAPDHANSVRRRLEELEKNIVGAEAVDRLEARFAATTASLESRLAALALHLDRPHQMKPKDPCIRKSVTFNQDLSKSTFNEDLPKSVEVTAPHEPLHSDDASGAAQCQFCMRRILRRDMRAHVDTDCKLAIVTCGGCGDKVRRWNLDHHKATCRSRQEHPSERSHDQRRGRSPGFSRPHAVSRAPAAPLASDDDRLRHATAWRPEDTSDYVSDVLCLPRVADIMLKHRISGAVLANMTEPDLLAAPPRGLGLASHESDALVALIARLGRRPRPGEHVAPSSLAQASVDAGIDAFVP